MSQNFIREVSFLKKNLRRGKFISIKAVQRFSTAVSCSYLNSNSFFLKTLIPLLFTFCLSSPLFPEENRSSYIRTLLDRRDLSAARSELDRHLKDSPNDPSVKFLQTELLIAESEAAESRGDIKTALEKLEKVIPEYPKHSNVVLRYEDLMKRKQNGGLNGIPNIILSGSPANTSLSERVAKLEERTEILKSVISLERWMIAVCALVAVSQTLIIGLLLSGRSRTKGEIK